MSVYYSKDLLDILEDVCQDAQAADRIEKELTARPESVGTELVEAVDPQSLQPARNIRKTYVQHGGLGSRTPVDGYYSPHDMKKYYCVHCKEMFSWSTDLEYTDFGEVIDNLCPKCRKELRAMRTNHPEML